ncbi:MAG TPA: DNA-binding protein [Steroidobacter sp.]
MARSGIYKSEVVRARDALRAQGRHPSIDAIRVELGNTGSKATIHRYLKEIEEEEGGAGGTQVALSEAIQDLIGRLAGRLHEEAEARIAEAKTRHTAMPAKPWTISGRRPRNNAIRSSANMNSRLSICRRSCGS